VTGVQTCALPISIPAGAGENGAPLYSHTTTCPVPAGVNVFRLVSHGHKRLADFKIYEHGMQDDSDAMLYESTDWANPKQIDFPVDAPLTIGADKGFRFSCSWANETAGAVQYGPTTNDEMCIMAATYYPKTSGPQNLDGNIFCVDGTLYY
jgi:hypothetical protein